MPPRAVSPITDCGHGAERRPILPASVYWCCSREQHVDLVKEPGFRPSVFLGVAEDRVEREVEAAGLETHHGGLSNELIVWVGPDPYAVPYLHRFHMKAKRLFTPCQRVR